jgi:hypothetical protein
MKDTPLDDDDRALLERAADMGCAGLDLRFEGGPWIGQLDRLADRGLLDKTEHEPAYMVSFMITEAGRAALAAG